MCALALPSLSGQGSLQEGIDADLKAALDKLNALRKEIREEKIPLAEELNGLLVKVRDARREAERFESRRVNRTLELQGLETRVTALYEERDYLGNLMAEFLRSLESQMPVSELKKNDATFLSIKNLVDDPAADPAATLESQMALLRFGLERVQRLAAGVTYEGSAIVPGGAYEEGIFVGIGPTTYFASKESDAAGIEDRYVADEPRVQDVGPVPAAAIQQVATSQTGRLPFDPTLGNALAMRQTEETLLEHIAKGGVWMGPILSFALVALLLAIWKSIVIYSIKLPGPGVLHDILEKLRAGDRDKALAAAERVPNPVGPMLEMGVRFAGANRELIDEVMYEKMLELQPRLERFLQAIAITAAISPLLGLLGTVTGMINTFKLITVFGTGDARSLSGGISEALITTEFGLIVAIPALIAHALLSRKVQAIMAMMEKMAVAFVNGLPENGQLKLDRPADPAA